MVPLTTVQGLSPDALRALFGVRPLYLWGSGDVALDVLVSLRRMGIVPRAFVDNRLRGEQVGEVCGLPCVSADVVLGAKTDASPRPFVVIASADYRLRAASACSDAGLERGRDFIDQLAVPRPVAVVEVSAPDGRHMARADFQQLLAKLLSDQPLLCHLELSWLGDPGKHPELASLISYAEQFVPCTVNTTLHSLVDVDGVLAARPSRLNFLVRGHGAAYDPAFGEGTWERAQTVLGALRGVSAPLRPGARIMLRYMRSAEVERGEYAAWQGEVANSVLRLNAEWPYVTPYDAVLAYARDGVPPADEEAQFATLPWSLSVALQLSAHDRELPCLSQRVFPVLAVDGTVSACHLYRNAKLAADYRTCEWATLLTARQTCTPCAVCQTQALHRLDVEVLARRHPEWRARLLGGRVD